MAAHSCVVLYGNSVFLAGIKAEFEREPGLELIVLDAGSPQAVASIREHQPRALLFDMAEGQPDFALALLREQPGLLLIGVDPASVALLVLSNQPTQVMNLADLIELTRSRSEAGKERIGEE